MISWLPEPTSGFSLDQLMRAPTPDSGPSELVLGRGVQVRPRGPTVESLHIVDQGKDLLRRSADLDAALDPDLAGEHQAAQDKEAEEDAEGERSYSYEAHFFTLNVENSTLMKQSNLRITRKLEDDCDASNLAWCSYDGDAPLR